MVQYAAWLKAVPAADSDVLVGKALDAVGLQDRAAERVRALSGGMRQRLLIATALVADPSVVILDEPTVGLDPEQRAIFRRLVRELGKSKAVLLATHLLEDVADLADRCVVIDAGRSLLTGSVGELVHEHGRGEASVGRPDGSAIETAYLACLGAAR